MQIFRHLSMTKNYCSQVMTTPAGCNYSNADKWTGSAMGGLLFIAVSSPFTYSLTNYLSGMVGIDIAGADGCPNTIGVITHSVIFTLLIRLIMERKGGCPKTWSQKDKLAISLIGGLLFLIVSSPYLYKIEDRYAEEYCDVRLSDLGGCPTTVGIITNAIVFVGLSRLLMY
jgi:hypothetical protein